MGAILRQPHPRRQEGGTHVIVSALSQGRALLASSPAPEGMVTMRLAPNSTLTPATSATMLGHPLVRAREEWRVA